MPVELILIVVLAGAGYLFYRDIKKSGKTQAQSEADKRALEHVKKYKDALERNRTDRSIAQRLRNKYNIK